jgi:isopropylmalate/isohomocitrate dehydrogenase-like protein
MKKICVLPGDGIGPEVTRCAVSALKAATDQLEFVEGLIGQKAYDEKGSYLPRETLDLMRSCDSTLFGAVTTPSTADYISPVLEFRKELDLYANLRPVRTVTRPTPNGAIDVVIIRENTEGLYTQNEVAGDSGVTTMRRVSRHACARIVGFAIDYCIKNGRSRLCCVHKANVLRKSDGLFLSVFHEMMAREGKTLRAEDQLVDSAGLHLVTDPGRFDSIVTLNLYGDILSDVAAGVAGGLGFAPSGNIGDRHSVFEPAHGSAPDIQGKGKANPTAAMLSGAMMLRHLGMSVPAHQIERAITSVYSSGHLTQDIGGRHGSETFTDHVLRAIHAKDSL